MHHDLSAVFRSHDASSWSHDLRSGSPDALMLPKADSVDHIAEVCVHVEEKKLQFSIDSTLFSSSKTLYCVYFALCVRSLYTHSWTCVSPTIAGPPYLPFLCTS